MTTETWHKRLEAALLARKLDYKDLVGVTGLSKPSVYAWKVDANKRSTMMDGDNAALVCDFLRISPMWLFHGKGVSGLEDGDTADPGENVRTLSPRPREEIDELMGYVELMDDKGLNRLVVEAKNLAERFPLQRKQRQS